MKKPLLIFLLFSFSLILFSQNYVQYVNPFIGTGGHGHTYPGATLPHGMVQLSPDTKIDGSWDGCSGYHYNDTIIYGFSHTHLSGTGISDYGDIMLMPVTKKSSAYTPKEYSSRFDHTTEDNTTEKASAGFYRVKLNDNNVTVELTSTLRTGFHRYVFHENEQAMVVLDLNHRDQLLEGEIEMKDDHTVSGYRYSKAWAQNQKIFFFIEFSRKIKLTLAIDDSLKVRDFKKINGQQLCANFFFDLNKKDTLLVKVGISGTSVEGAKLNLLTENPGWNFNEIKEQAREIWNKELGKIEVVCETKSDYEIFYTALYHTAIVPNIYNDVDGKYRGRDDEIHTKEDGNYYTVFSLWDTFRTAHPLYTLIDQQRTKDYVETFIRQFQEVGRLPVWELSSNETECMIGIHSISVIADAVSKELIDDKYKDVLVQAMIATSKMIDYKGIGFMNSQNYLTIENESESVSKTLEYCYQYACMAEICRWAGKEGDAVQFEWISMGYKNLFNLDTGFFVTRSNGGWLPNFDPTEVNNNFTEANAWQYAFFVPHDIKRMVEIYGGKEKFHAKLDSMFGTTSKMTGREQQDITNLIGQYAHGNEPSHHIAYLYNYVGDFKSASKIISKICNEFYSNHVDGLSGNEDCGQMSAWYVLSALGLYQVNPGSPNYTITIPQVLSAKIHLENGNIIAIKRDKGEINRINWNGIKYEKLFIAYNELMKGGELSFENGSSNEIKDGDILSTSNMDILINELPYLSAPVINISSPIFEKETRVNIKSDYQNLTTTFYTIKYESGKIVKKQYKKPFKVNKNSIISAYSCWNNGEQSSMSISKTYKLPYNYNIEIKSIANVQYFAGGPQGLLDGVYGDIDWRKGNWHGYQGQDFVAIVDTKKPSKNNWIVISFIEDTRSWIYFPDSISLYVSNDNIDYQLREIEIMPIMRLEKYVDNTELKEIKFNIKGLESFRYFKIVAKNYGPLPKGHPGEGNPSYIFIDEIEFTK